MECRSCGATIEDVFVDLGETPLANSFLDESDLDRPEPRYPLKAWVCRECLLVQLPAYEAPENLFRNYAYFSSYSDTWLEHCRRYADAMIERLKLTSESRIVEVASNDGYLLRFFKGRGMDVLGVEPAENVAAAAREAGVPTVSAFFGERFAAELVEDGGPADLLIANNVLAHVPDLNGFVRGIQVAIGEEGLATLEFPHLLQLVAGNEFDTIYHEHFSYFSLHSVSALLGRHGLRILDVEELPTHGGSLRLYVSRRSSRARADSVRIDEVLGKERDAGLHRIRSYRGLQAAADVVREDLLRFLRGASEEGRTVVAYGAPAKGNTLLNFCEVGPELLPFTVDRNPAKQGRYLPGSHIPVRPTQAVREARPDYLLILPWNLKAEIMQQNAFIREWGGRFVIPIPCLEILA